MRILIAGFVAFVIWCFISAWLYNDKLLPVLHKPVPEVTTPEIQTNEADSLAKLKALMPKDLTIYFEFNDAKFKADPQIDNSIAEFKAWLDKYPGMMISVRGYTDIVGTVEFNQDLGMERAAAVGKYLEAGGIPATKIITESMGETMAAVDFITAEGRAKSRKTEVSIKLN